MPRYDPDSWRPHQWNNNCYDYACDNRTNRPRGAKSQPGAASGTAIGPDTPCPDVVAAAVRDGLQSKINNRDIDRHDQCDPGCWKVALFISTANGSDTIYDYHFLRQDDLGGWSHKMDHRVVYDTDASGRILRDPETADLDYRHAARGRGPVNYKFCAYLCVCPDLVSISDPDVSATSDDETATTISPPPSQPIALTLTKPARIVADGMELHLPAGVLEIRYSAEHGAALMSAPQARKPTVRRLVYSGRHDPEWVLAAAELAWVVDALARLQEEVPTGALEVPRFMLLDLPESAAARFAAVGEGLVAVELPDGTSRIFADSVGLAEQLARITSEARG